MKKKANKWIIGIIFSVSLMIIDAPPAHAVNITIPGNESRVCYYANFFFNFPSEDFLYYLNDFLLFSERPDETILSNGRRDKLLLLLTMHKSVKNFIQKQVGKEKNSITLNTIYHEDVSKATVLSSIMGRKLKKSANDQYTLERLFSIETQDYFDFSLIQQDILETQLNKTGFFTVSATESEIPLMNGLDMMFFREATGLPLDSSNFFEYMVKNERLSLLVGTLYRMSENEILYITNMSGDSTSAQYKTWKRIYENKKLSMGLFVLSNALRVQENGNKPIFPGGDAAESFWVKMAGGNLEPSSIEFLERLAMKDDGKLNYLYVFSYFLPEDTRKALFFNYDADKVKEIYTRISLGDKEKLSDSVFPTLGDWTLYTLMYALKMENGTIYFPQGIEEWLKTVNGDTPIVTQTEGSSDTLFQLLKTLVERAGAGDNDKKVNEIRKFMAIYTKFSNRPQLLAEGALSMLYNNYEKYNAVVDYIEKIPVKNPGTILKLFEWVPTLERLEPKDEELFISIYQALFEILSFTAKYAPDRFDYDKLVTEAIKIPLNRPLFCSRLFKYFKENLEIGKKFPALRDVMMAGIDNQIFRLQNSKYEFAIKDIFEGAIDQVLQSQEMCALDVLEKIDSLLERGLLVKPPSNTELASQLNENYRLVPNPGMSEDAPKNIRMRVNSVPVSKINKLVEDFVKKMLTGAENKELENIKNELEGDFLIYQLKDHLMALAYAVNAKDPGLKAFLNPNFVRLHDIRGLNSRSLWDNFSVGINRNIPLEFNLSEIYLSGPLSRLNVVFAAKWRAHLLREINTPNPALIDAIISNMLEFYPLPHITLSMAYNAQLVNLGLELLRAVSNSKIELEPEPDPEDDEESEVETETGTEIATGTETGIQKKTENQGEKIKRQLIPIVRNITAGYHYRRMMEYISGKSDNANFYFTELNALGEAYFQEVEGESKDKEKSPVEFVALKKLMEFCKAPLADRIKQEDDSFGSIYPYTFGNLNLHRFRLFPQEVSTLFGTSRIGGDMIDEYKFKLAYHLEKKKIRPFLMGQFLFMYLKTTVKNFLRQNHIHDYPSVYFIFDIFNNSHLNGLIKQLKKEGSLRIQ